MAVGVQTEKKGGEVMLRGEKIPLTGSVSGEKGEQIPFALYPNKWTAVPHGVYAMLKAKFGKPKYREVLDHDANADSPHKAGEDPQMRTAEVSQYIIEFRD